MSAKPKVAFYWCASCGGCEETIIDLNEDILKVVDAVDIVLWPVALDFKRKDIEALSDGEIAVAFINGTVRLSEHQEWIELLRAKSQLVIAFGSCAHIGGIPALANATSKEQVFERKYTTTPTVDNLSRTYPTVFSKVNGHELDLPEFFPIARTLDQSIDVDYYLPGCPPPSNLVWDAVVTILEGRLPQKGAVLAPEKPLCDTCPRNESKPDQLAVSSFKRIATNTPDPEECFLAQGYICMGPATRSGCGERCIGANMPCRGCFGHPDADADQGAKMLSAVASLIDSADAEQIASVTASIADPLGTFYRFGLASSLLRHARTGGN